MQEDWRRVEHKGVKHNRLDINRTGKRNKQ
jgi:hypothetical protein